MFGFFMKRWRCFKMIWNVRESLPLLIRLFLDQRVKKYTKILLIGVSAAYFIFPFDFIYDVPFIGQIDDVAVFMFMITWFIDQVPDKILKEYGWNTDTKKSKKNKKKK